LVLPLSGFSAWIHLGVLTALMMGVSALATLTIIPALFITTRPKMLGAVPMGYAWPATARIRAAAGN